MVRYNELNRLQYIKPAVLFEEVEQDMGLMNDGASGQGQSTGKPEGDTEEDAKASTFIFEEDYDYNLE